MSTARDSLIAELAELRAERGITAFYIADAATEADLRYLIRAERILSETEGRAHVEAYFAAGAKKQGVFGGNRVQLTKTGIAVRPQYDPRRAHA